MTERLHICARGATRAELGRDRGAQLAPTLAAAYDGYADLFRTVGIPEHRERDGARRALDAVADWRPEVAQEILGLAAGSGLDVEQIAALNARTEILAAAPLAGHECSTVAAVIGGRRLAVQTWDWHIELDPYWHTQEVSGPGYRYAGLTEQGILGKIGVNEAGLSLHFNILGHEADAPGGVPMHVLSAIVLSECGGVDEAIELIRSAPVSSSSAFTLSDSGRQVSVEISPAGVFEIEATGAAAIRTNHFLHPTPLGGQKPVYEPDSSERFALLDSRLAAGLPGDADGLVAMLVSGEGEAALCCVADMSKPLGDRWETLATVITEPDARRIRILDGMPSDAGSGAWRTIEL